MEHKRVILKGSKMAAEMESKRVQNLENWMDGHSAEKTDEASVEMMVLTMDYSLAVKMDEKMVGHLEHR